MSHLPVLCSVHGWLVPRCRRRQFGLVHADGNAPNDWQLARHGLLHQRFQR